MYSFDLPISTFVQLLLQALAFLAISVVGLTRMIDGAWAALATIGGGFAAAVTLVELAAYVEGRYLDTSHVLEFVFLDHQHLGDVLVWLRVAGIVLVAAAFMVLVRRRTDPAETSGRVV